MPAVGRTNCRVTPGPAVPVGLLPVCEELPPTAVGDVEPPVLPPSANGGPAINVAAKAAYRMVLNRRLALLYEPNNALRA